MRRVTLAIALGLALASFAVPQENGNKSSEAAESEGSMTWKWVNFAILAAGLGYLIAKNAPAYFQARTDQIHKELKEAAKEFREAEAKASGIEARLARIQNEVDSLRAAARTEMNAESERVRQETERHLKRIQDQASQEIVLLTRTAQNELRIYSAALALDLAEKRIRSGITSTAQDTLVDNFVDDLHQRAKRGVAA